MFWIGDIVDVGCDSFPWPLEKIPTPSVSKNRQVLGSTHKNARLLDGVGLGDCIILSDRRARKKSRRIYYTTQRRGNYRFHLSISNNCLFDIV